MNYGSIALPLSSPPDEPEVPDYIVQDAVETVANRLKDAGEVDELVSVVSESNELMDWLGNQPIPFALRAQYREIARKAKNLRQSVDEEVAREMQSLQDEADDMRAGL